MRILNNGRANTVSEPVNVYKIDHPTVTMAVRIKNYFFYTVEPSIGRQFVSCFLNYQQSKLHEIAVHSQKSVFHTVV